MARGLENKYFFKKHEEDEWIDVTTAFDGLRILSVSGFGEYGEAVNVYNEQWVDSQEEDFFVTKKVNQLDMVVRKNTNLVMNIIISRRYASTSIDEQSTYDAFANMVATSGDFYIYSKYTNMVAHVICLDSFKPTTQLLNRGSKSYIMASITLHTLDMPSEHSSEPVTHENELYIGFGGEYINASNIKNLASVAHYEEDDVANDYTIVCTSTNYLWICSTQDITNVSSSGFDIPLTNQYTDVTLGGRTFKCYRTYNRIVPHTMNFTISTQ
jgi:hypothetical protein